MAAEDGTVVARGAKAWALRQLKLGLEAMIRLAPNGRRAFLDPADFPWIEGLERGWPDIRRELDAVMADGRIPAFAELSPLQKAIAGENWKSYLFKVGAWWIDSNCAACPQTAKLLRTIPGLQSGMFSVLTPRSHLNPHRGPYSGALRYHLALKIPEPRQASGLRVDGQVVHWTEGESLIFDDSFLHDAWNGTDEVRVVLFLDVERPLPVGLRHLNRALLKLASKAPFLDEIRHNLELHGKTVAHG